MEFDVTIFPTDLNGTARLAQQVEAYGFSGLNTADAAHNPFLPLTHAAAATQRIMLGTSIAVAFPRSPMVMANTAWDLAEQSNGRFILGLGTQVRAHITKRFGIKWTKPIPRMREYIESLRAIWNTWQTGAPLRYEGQDYQFTLMTPFFSPQTPLANPHIPIYIAGVGESMCALAGELCDGLHVHPFHTVRYIKEVTLPAVQSGADRSGRELDDIRLSCAVFVVTGNTDEEINNTTMMVKSQIAFYASTPSYSGVLALHGWESIAETLGKMVRTGQWDDLWKEVPDEMLNEIAIVAPPDELPHKLKARYDGILDRVGYYLPFDPDDKAQQPVWQAAAKVFGK